MFRMTKRLYEEVLRRHLFSDIVVIRVKKTLAHSRTSASYKVSCLICMKLVECVCWVKDKVLLPPDVFHMLPATADSQACVCIRQRQVA